MQSKLIKGKLRYTEKNRILYWFKIKKKLRNKNRIPIVRWKQIQPERKRTKLHLFQQCRRKAKQIKISVPVQITSYLLLSASFQSSHVLPDTSEKNKDFVLRLLKNIIQSVTPNISLFYLFIIITIAFVFNVECLLLPSFSPYYQFMHWRFPTIFKKIIIFILSAYINLYGRYHFFPSDRQ